MPTTMTSCFAASSPLFFSTQSRTRTTLSISRRTIPTRSCAASGANNNSSASSSDAPSPSPPSSRNRVSRRHVLFGLAAFGLLSDESAARAEQPELADSELMCKNCYGEGRVSCELCGGSGFWRALMGNDENLRYKGVTCPECDGAGKTTCPVCLGTKEANVRGLLRRRSVEPGPGRILQSN